MTTLAIAAPFYVVSGTLPLASPSYVERQSRLALVPLQTLSGLNTYVSLAPRWWAYRYHVDMTAAALPGHGMITLEFGKEAGEVWLADMLLVPDDAPLPSKTPVFQ